VIKFNTHQRQVSEVVKPTTTRRPFDLQLFSLAG